MTRYPLFFMLFLAAIACGLGFIPLNWAQLPHMLRPLGWGLLLAGAGLLFGAAGLFKRTGTTLDPTQAPQKLVTTGLYRISRNPMYLGMLLILLGIPFALHNILSAACAWVFYWVMDKVVIPREEERVVTVFGEAFAAYCKKVRRWV